MMCAWKGWEAFNPEAVEVAGTPKQSKYSNRKVNVDGVMFDSKREAARWMELGQEQRAGLISGLKRQVPFDLTAIARDPGAAATRGFQKIGEYRADFTYTRDGVYVVEDSKGYRTDVYRWKRKHFSVEYGITILET
jgi:hypothetical protein